MTLDAIRSFARDLTRDPFVYCGHADAWGRVSRAADRDDVIVALGYCAGYADAIRCKAEYLAPPHQVADILGTAARTFLLAAQLKRSVDVSRCAETYRAELRELLRRLP